MVSWLKLKGILFFFCFFFEFILLVCEKAEKTKWRKCNFECRSDRVVRIFVKTTYNKYNLCINLPASAKSLVIPNISSRHSKNFIQNISDLAKVFLLTSNHIVIQFCGSYVGTATFCEIAGILCRRTVFFPLLIFFCKRKTFVSQNIVEVLSAK